VSGPRAVRIPRPRSELLAPSGIEPAPSPGRRRNLAGTQRAVRTAIVYAGMVLLVTAFFSALELASSNASHPGEQQALELFLGVAVVLLVGSTVFALSPAPRSLEVGEGKVVVVGPWGTRRTFGPLSSLAPRVLKHFPDGLLSSRSVDMVEVADVRGRRHVYQVESGLFDPD